MTHKEYMLLGEEVDHCRHIEQNNRKLQGINILCVSLKALFFLQLSENMSLLIGTIFKILYEIRYFLFVLFFAIAGFGNAFYLMGRNQMQFEKIPVGSHPMYGTWMGAI